MSRLLLSCTAISWVVWLAVSPLAWTGCSFNFSVPGFRPPELQVRVTVAQDMDLTQVTTVYAKVSGAHSEERLVSKPAEGWPAGAQFPYAPGSGGKIVITITAYDASNRLIGLGRGESENYSDVHIEVQSRIPWN